MGVYANLGVGARSGWVGGWAWNRIWATALGDGRLNGGIRMPPIFFQSLPRVIYIHQTFGILGMIDYKPPQGAQFFSRYRLWRISCDRRRPHGLPVGGAGRQGQRRGQGPSQLLLQGQNVLKSQKIICTTQSLKKTQHFANFYVYFIAVCPKIDELVYRLMILHLITSS